MQCAASLGIQFTARNVPNLQQKVYIVTGSSAGIGLEAAKTLAGRDGHVIVASRDPERNERAVQEIRQKSAGPNATVEWMQCDTTDFRSMRRFVDDFKKKNLPLHCLINNAGVENPPDRRTPEGLDVTMATNYFGTYYLTHMLMEDLKASAPSRMVITNSLSEMHGHLEFDDLKGERFQKDGRPRSGYKAYACSKLALTMFARELQRRLRTAAPGVDVFMAHPGVAVTDAFRKSDHSKSSGFWLDKIKNFLAQPGANGCVPLLYTATAPELEGQGGGSVTYGPLYAGLPYNMLGFWGSFTMNIPTLYSQGVLNPAAYDAAACRRLYDDTFALLQSFDSIPGGMGEPLTEKAVATLGKAERHAYAAAH